MLSDAVGKVDAGVTSAQEVVRVFGAEAEEEFRKRVA
jgi:capsid protein